MLRISRCWQYETVKAEPSSQLVSGMFPRFGVFESEFLVQMEICREFVISVWFVMVVKG